MKPCPSCSRQLADNAVTCPQCGHAFPKRTKEEKEESRPLGLILLIFGSILTWWPWRMGYFEQSIMYDSTLSGVHFVSYVSGLILLFIGLILFLSYYE